MAQFCNPSGVAVDAAGNLYVADTGNDTIRKITPARVVATVGKPPEPWICQRNRKCGRS